MRTAGPQRSVCFTVVSTCTCVMPGTQFGEAKAGSPACLSTSPHWIGILVLLLGNRQCVLHLRVHDVFIFCLLCTWAPHDWESCLLDRAPASRWCPTHGSYLGNICQMNKVVLKAKMVQWDRCYNRNVHPKTGYSEDLPSAICFEVALHKHASGLPRNLCFHLRNCIWASVGDRQPVIQMWSIVKKLVSKLF